MSDSRATLSFEPLTPVSYWTALPKRTGIARP